MSLFASRPLRPFEEGHVLVIGDAIADVAHYGSVRALDQTASVPVMQTARTQIHGGGAVNCALNVLALGAPVRLMCQLGDDANGRALYTQLNLCDWRLQIDLPRFNRRTPTTERYYDQYGRLFTRTRSWWQINRPPETYTAERLARGPRPRVIVVSDYGKGWFTARSLDAVFQYGAQHDVPVIVDPFPAHTTMYTPGDCVTIMTPNEDEAAQMGALVDPTVAQQAIMRLAPYYKNTVIITRGRHGMLITRRDGSFTHYPVPQCPIADTNGAGDSVVASLAVETYLDNTRSLEQMLPSVVAAAEVAVTHCGAYPVPLHEQFAVFARRHTACRVVDLETAAHIARVAARAERQVGVANGVFDLLHVGHLALLERAAQCCHVLIALVNSDASVARLKPGRPIIPAEQRCALLAALEAVDMVVTFDESTPVAAIKRLRPQYLFKGPEFADNIDAVPGAAFVRSTGGVARALDGPNISTTTIIERACKWREAHNNARDGGSDNEKR